MRPPSRRRPCALLWIALIAVALGFGCEAQREAELLEITEVSPDRLEPGRTVVVTGRGFPPGRAARVRFVGTVHRPGRTPIETRVEIEGRALSAERVEARFTRIALRELGGRGTLHGRVSVVFATRGGPGVVIGRSPELELDVSAAGTRGLSAALSRQRRAEQLMAQLGLSLEEESSGAPGLPVAEVLESSLAERAGVVVGDRLVEISGVRLHSLSDAVPAPGVDELTLRVARRGQAAPYAVRIPLAQRRGTDRHTVAYAQIALGWVLLVLLLVAPSATLLDALARRTFPARGPKQKRPRLRVLWKRYRDELAVALAGLGVVGALPALDRQYGVDLPLEALLLGALAVRVSASWVASTGVSRRDRIVALVQAFTAIGIAALSIGALAALSGTADLFAIARTQGALPIEWTLLRTPIAPLALGVLVWAGVHAPSTLARGRGSAAKLARRLDDAVLLALAVVAAAVFFGGWGPRDGEASARLTRAVSFTATAWIGWLWVRHARKSARWTRGSFGGVVVATVALVAAVGLWIGLEPDPALVRGLAQVVAGGLVTLGVLVLWRLASGRLRRAPFPAQPFL